MPRPRRSETGRRWRYLGETAGVLADVRRADGSTLLAHPAGVYDLHPDHDHPDFEHPLLEETTDPAYDPAATAGEPAPAADSDTPSESTGDSTEPTEEQ